MPPKKKGLNKKSILKNLIIIPRGSKREVYAREMKLLNDLIARYSEDFICVLTLKEKYDSIAVILSESYKKELDLKFSNFNYKIDVDKYASPLLSEKIGEDIQVFIKPKTIRNFLNG
jgi:hypothetical protein